MMFLLDFYDMSLGFLLDSCWISRIFFVDYYDISMGFVWGFHSGSLEFP